MTNKREPDFETNRSYVLERLKKEGILVKIGKKRPIKNQYSGIIGNENKILNINIP